MCVALLGGASNAWAGVAVSVPPDIPTTVTVGTTVASAVNITWANTAAQSTLDNVINPGSITLVPSCGANPVGPDCPAANVDPGALIPTPTNPAIPTVSSGVGEAGTACGGINFTITLTDATMGKYTFTWVGTITLTPTGATTRCTINFTTDVKRVPVDADAGVAGLQTTQASGANVTATGGLPGSGTGSAITTVARGATSIQTQVSPTPIALGGSFHDTATMTKPAVGPTVTGNVRFDVFGPGDPNCAGAPTFTSTNPLNAAGTIATSANFTPTAPGTWKVIATYLGDANYVPLASLCNDPAEAVAVTTPPPPPPGTPPPPPPPCTPPPGPAPPGGEICTTPPEVCTPPPGPAPPGGELCARGTAAIRGTTGCANLPFRVVVRGRQIERVTFALDGRVVSVLNRANRGSLWVLTVNPRTKRIGVHRITARTVFKRQSGTRARTLRVTFSRCARRATSPAFTG